MLDIETQTEHSDGTVWPKWRLTNHCGASVVITSFGATILEVNVADRHQQFNDVVLGFKQLNDYQNNTAKFGCVVGPYANRICNARFTLESTAHQLPRNDGIHHLHGGNQGLHQRLWRLNKTYREPDRVTVELSCELGREESGYPANYQFFVRYSWTDNNELIIDYGATVDASTILNPTQHSYFNLAGVERIDTVLDHQLWINSCRICDIDAALIPTGNFLDTNNTALDFNTPKTLSQLEKNSQPLIEQAGGLDFNWVFDLGIEQKKQQPTLKATLYHPASGRQLDVISDQPGLQVYTGNFLNGEKGKYDQIYQRHHGICLETQHFPDSPNHSHFPSVELHPGQSFSSTTIYHFSTCEKH